MTVAATLDAPLRIWAKGDRVRLSVVNGGETIAARVEMASANGRSLIVAFPDEVFAGYFGRLPLLWQDFDFRDLVDLRPFRLEPLSEPAS